MDLLERLAASTLFKDLTHEQLRLIAEVAREHTVPPGTVLCRQADLGSTYFVIDSGEAVIRRVDDRGFSRPVGTLRAGDAFGTTSLLLSEPRDATVISRTEMHLWTIEREAFDRLVQQNPSIYRGLSVPSDVAARLRLPSFPWLNESERVVHYCHRHWLPLAARLLLATLVLAVLLGGLGTWLTQEGYRWNATPWLLVPVALYLAYVTWHWFDWLNDQVVVTTQRISYRQQVAFFYEARNQIPIERVQNINIETSLFGRLLRYGNMLIETAAETGTLVLEQIPSPERVRDAIWDQTTRAQATQHAMERRLMADALASQLGIDTREELPEGQTAVGDGGATAIGTSRGFWSRVFGPPRKALQAQGTPEQVIWRKHWIFLLRSVLLPLLVVLLVLGLFLWLQVQQSVPGGWAVYSLLLLALAIASSLWLAWVIIDWANDQYIVTDDRIVDVEQRPFAMRSERREASLSVIQNVRFVIPHFGAAILGYGNVIIQTAGKGDFTFDRVGNPGEVQAEIFRRIEAYRARERQREAAQRRQEMAEWFAVYKELGEGDGHDGVAPSDL